MISRESSSAVYKLSQDFESMIFWVLVEKSDDDLNGIDSGLPIMSNGDVIKGLIDSVHIKDDAKRPEEFTGNIGNSKISTGEIEFPLYPVLGIEFEAVNGFQLNIDLVLDPIDDFLEFEFLSNPCNPSFLRIEWNNFCDSHKA